MNTSSQEKLPPPKYGLTRDIDGAEVAHLLAACPIRGSRVLEIGCGEGFLTWQLAGIPQQYIALDPNGERLAQAQAARPAVVPPVPFIQARAENLPFPDGAFEIAIFAHSL